jgi:hypothetical protein
MKLAIMLILVNYAILQPDDLSIDILPSERYKLNKRDLNNLKSDVERQVTLIVI